MNRRMRSPCRRAAARTERLQRFLKPGALARLRDSKICARSPRSLQISVARISPPGSPVIAASAMPIEELEGEQIRFFASRMCAPRILLRKKLAAAKYVFFAPPSPDPSDSVLDVFGADLVTAH
ncbi:uncharacterized protein LOC110022815 [Phalaenopsis equestris]|uniref:uncharacterized protein LOC110022815 n=1 Tax=Phalaenopsis equestris TaxID=78828 RepID=UPI0009E639DC|nr:uncharacterized protein LOC110022815 [Phalaenopsis equestris]